MSAREKVAQEIASRIKDGEIIGVGTGTTVEAALDAIRQRLQREKLHIRVVPTSLQSAWKCQQAGLEVMYPAYRGELAWGFDGADAVDENLWAIKGKGGAMLQEKILAVRCKSFVIIVDESKLVKQLGGTAAIPVEVIPTASAFVEQSLMKIGATSVEIRAAGTGKHGPVITEAGNLVFDAHFSKITANLEAEIKSIVGVVESGLFVGYAHEVLVGTDSAVRSLKSKSL
ncbi:MAG: ribose-5-phosphate isomerase RpiA [Deltaproteobacteria bacterium]|nr:ribose-5-phosphate isomerase RpiA [Deltaproteobacteria bacterium]